MKTLFKILALFIMLSMSFYLIIQFTFFGADVAMKLGYHPAVGGIACLLFLLSVMVGIISQ